MTLDSFVERLAEEAAARGVDVTCAVDAVDAPHSDDAPAVDLVAGGNTVTLWPGDGESVWVRASVRPETSIFRLKTAETSVPMNDASIALLIALLGGQARYVIPWGQPQGLVVVRHANTRLSLPVVHLVIASIGGAAEKEALEDLTGALVGRLTEEAARRGLEFTYAVSSEEGFGVESIARVDVTWGPNVVTLWPENDDLVWCRASVTLKSSSRRVDTVACEILADDEAIRLLVGLVNGEGRIVHRRLLSDVFEIRQGKAFFQMPLPGPPVGLERVFA